jgi:geranylgeranyl pyrophosphate synthase
MGVEQARQKAKYHLEEAMAELSGFDERAEPLRLIAKFVVERTV